MNETPARTRTPDTVGTASGGLTTHVLDTVRGTPAAGISIAVYRVDGDARRRVGGATTNAGGRTDQPLLFGPDLAVGSYELVFHVGDYFRAAGIVLPEPPFLDEVRVRFGVAEAGAHYHVPLLVSPFGYTTYRGG